MWSGRAPFSCQRSCLLYLCGLLFCMLGLPGLAVGEARVEEDPNPYPTMYLGLAFAAGVDEFDSTDDFSDFNDAIGVDFWIGFRPWRYLALEGQLTYLDGFDTELEIPGFFPISVDFEVYALSANLKLYPFDGWFQPFVVAGIGGARIEAKANGNTSSEDGSIYRFGGGVDIYFTKGFAVVLGGDYVLTGGDIDGADIIEIKLGLQYKF
jgi:opacity protein-like surface antigen